MGGSIPVKLTKKKIKQKELTQMSNTLTVKPKSIFIRSNVSDGKGAYAKPEGTIQHRLYITTETLEEIPEELFAVKLSQSAKPERKGKLVFKYFSWEEEGKGWNDLVGDGSPALIAQPVATIKQLVVEALKNATGLRWSLQFNSPSPFLNVETPNGKFIVYDNKKYPNTLGLPSDADGNRLYYLKSDADIELGLESAVSNGNDYYRLSLTSKNPDGNAVFGKSSVGQEWNPEGGDAQEPENTDASTNPWA